MTAIDDNKKNKKVSAGQITFTVLFLLALAAVNYFTLRTFLKSDVSGAGSPLKILAGDVLLALLAFLLSRKKCDRLRESGIAACAAAVAGPALALLLTETLLGNLQTMDIGAVFLNLAIYYLFFLLFAGIAGRLIPASGLVCTITLIAALVEYYVMEFRGQPITLFDLQSIRTAASVAGGYTYDLTAAAGLLLQVYLGYLLLLHFLKKIRIPRTVSWSLIRLGAAACGVFCLFLLEQNAENDTFDFWNINGNYQKNGFVYTLLWETGYVNPEKPEGYSTKKVETVAAEAEQNYVDAVQETEQNNSGAAQDTEQNTSGAVQPQNLIVIMNESLADFTHLGEIKTDTEIMPFLNSLKENTVKGYLQVPVIGGGTVETEYEFLTGNTKQFLPAGSTAYMIYCEDPEYGIVRTLKAQGYRTVALHPYYAANWNRSAVYPELGFDGFYSIENWGSEPELIRSMASDAAAYEKVIELVEESEDRLFTFLVTLQNHGGYADETLNGYEPTVELDYDQEYPQAETYLSLLNESDKAFEELIRYFEKSEESVMIVMFGDHFPGVEDEFYTEVLGKQIMELSDEEQQKVFQTPYIIWTNYDLDADSNGETISANFLGSEILEMAGLELTTYQKFLLELKESIPVVGRGMICDAQGNWYSLDDLPEEYAESVNQYQALQYYRISDRGDLTAGIYGLSGS